MSMQIEVNESNYISPSQMPRAYLCPGAPRMEKDAPDPGENIYSAEGTLLHAKCLPMSNLDDLEPEQKEVVSKCLNVLAKFKGNISESSIEYEKNLKLVINDRFLSSGTADVFIHDKELNQAIVIDWKFGRNPVEPVQENWQLIAYSIMAAKMTGAEKVTAVVFQPRIGNLSQHTFSAFELEIKLLAIMQIIGRAFGEELILNPSDEACRYCKAITFCPAVQITQNKALKGRYDLQDPATLLLLKPHLDAIKKRVDEIERIFYAKVCNGEIPGWETWEKSKGTEIIDPDGLFDMLCEKYQVTPADFYKHCKISFSGLRDMVTDKLAAEAKEAGVKKTKTSIKDDFCAAAEPFTEERGKSTLIRKAKNPEVAE